MTGELLSAWLDAYNPSVVYFSQAQGFTLFNLLLQNLLALIMPLVVAVLVMLLLIITLAPFVWIYKLFFPPL
jgi:hypothetical protein